MKEIILIATIFFFSCSLKQERNDFLTTYLYRMYATEDNYNTYFTEKIYITEDTIKISRYYHDENFMVKNKENIIYIKDFTNLYRIDNCGDKRLFFTIDNNENVLFNVKYIMQDDDFSKLTEEELYEIAEESFTPIYGYNHQYLKDTTLISTKGDFVRVHKFFVNRSYYKDIRSAYDGFLDTDYYFYYTEDFLLYKTEYLGRDTYHNLNIEILRLGNILDVFIVDSIDASL